MKRPTVIAAWAACLWIAFGLESIVRREPQNYRDTLFLLPFFVTLWAFRELHGFQKWRRLRIELWGFGAVMIASGLVAVGNIGLIAGIPALEIFSAPMGILLWTVGLIFFGVGTIQAGVLPRYTGVVLMLLEPFSVLTGLALSPIAPINDRGAYTGAVEKGVALALIAMAMHTASVRRRPIAQHA
jgi:hypothetical protein